MYKSFFGLKSKPFRLNPHLRFLFNSEAIQRAVNTLKYGLYQREGLVLLTSMAFLLAVVRLARQQVLVQQLPAVETLARVDTLLLDKTGTITDGNTIFTCR